MEGINDRWRVQMIMLNDRWRVQMIDGDGGTNDRWRRTGAAEAIDIILGQKQIGDKVYMAARGCNLQ